MDEESIHETLIAQQEEEDYSEDLTPHVTTKIISPDAVDDAQPEEEEQLMVDAFPEVMPDLSIKQEELDLAF